MPRPFHTKVVTANDLIGGDVVYLGFNDNWTRQLSEAVILPDPEMAEQALSRAQLHSSIVVGVYLADAVRGNSGAEPVHFREAFRSRGPSNYPHGKQAEA